MNKDTLILKIYGRCFYVVHCVVLLACIIESLLMKDIRRIKCFFVMEYTLCNYPNRTEDGS